MNDNKYFLYKRRKDGKEFKIHFETSYFYNIRFFKRNYLPISICIWDPKWYKQPIKQFNNIIGMTYNALIPRKYDSESDCEHCIEVNKEDFDNGKFLGDIHCNYLENYRKQLSIYNVERTLQDICEKADNHYNFDNFIINNNNNSNNNYDNNNEIHLIFIGYEIPERICTERYILAEWIEKNSEYKVNELSKKCKNCN